MRHATRMAGWMTAGLCVAGLSAGCSDYKVTGEPVQLFSGKGLMGWKAMDPANSAWQVAGKVAPDPADAKRFVIEPGEGLMVNGATGHTSNLYTEAQHGDCKLHLEFMVPQGSNSGVYFMGLYEVQILDSWGKEEVQFSDCGGIYARWINETNVDGHAPRVNASRAPGEWQSYDVVFRAPRFDAAGNKIEDARFVKVVHNGVMVHEDVVLKGPTRASMPGPESALGPLMLQGDHGPVAYRNIVLTPIEIK